MLYNVVKRVADNSENLDFTPKVSKEELQEYLKDHSRDEARRHFHVSSYSLLSYLKLYGLENLAVRARWKPRKELPPKEEVVEYLKNHTLEEFRAHFKFGNYVASRCLETYGLRSLTVQGVIEVPAKKVLQKYLHKHSVTETAIYFNVNKSIVEKWIADYGIAKTPANTLNFSAAAKHIGCTKMSLSIWNQKGLIRNVVAKGNRLLITLKEVERLKKYYDGKKINCTKKGVKVSLYDLVETKGGKEIVFMTDTWKNVQARKKLLSVSKKGQKVVYDIRPSQDEQKYRRPPDFNYCPSGDSQQKSARKAKAKRLKNTKKKEVSDGESVE